MLEDNEIPAYSIAKIIVVCPMQLETGTHRLCQILKTNLKFPTIEFPEKIHIIKESISIIKVRNFGINPIKIFSRTTMGFIYRQEMFKKSLKKYIKLLQKTNPTRTTTILRKHMNTYQDT